MCSVIEINWIKNPNVEEPSVQVVLKFAVEEFNNKTGDSLKYNTTHEVWYVELDENNLKYLLHLKTTDCLERVRHYKAIVHEHKLPNEIIRTLESFDIVYVDTNGECWSKIPSFLEPHVQEVEKFPVEEFNSKNGDYLKYIGTYESWYRVLDGNKVKYRFHLEALPCVGRVRNYEAIVLEQKPLTEKIRTLESFKLILKEK